MRRLAYEFPYLLMRLGLRRLPHRMIRRRIARGRR